MKVEKPKIVVCELSPSRRNCLFYNNNNSVESAITSIAFVILIPFDDFLLN